MDYTQIKGDNMSKNYVQINKATEYEYHAEGLTVTVMAGMPDLSFENPKNVKKPARLYHTHSWFELFYVKKGELRFDFENGEEVISEGHFLLVAPDFSHYTAVLDIKTEVFVFNFFIEKNESTKYSEKTLKFLSFGDYICLPGDAEMAQNADALAAAIVSENAIAAGCRLVLLLDRAKETANFEKENENTVSDNEITRIYQLEQIFNNLFREHIVMRDVARALNISEKQLSRVVRKKYGCSFYKRLTDIRMKTAATLIKEGKSISEIAAVVGYDSVPGFIGAFKKKYGCTPAKYKVISKK